MICPSVPQVDDSLEMSDGSRSRNTQELATYIVGNVAFGFAHTQQQHAISLRSRPETKPEDQSPLALTSCRGFQTMLDFQKLWIANAVCV